MLADKLRKAVLQAAIQGKLTKQLPTDGNAADLVAEIKKEKERLIKEKKIKKQKSLPEITAEEIPFEIPDNWCWVRLGSVIELLSGRDLLKDDYSDIEEGVPYITGASNFVNDHIIINRWTEKPMCIALQNDILLTCKGTIGELAILDKERAHIARQVMAIRAIKSDTKYFFYYIKSQIDKLKSLGKSIIPGINRENILWYIMPLPPLIEQKRIVEIIEKILNQIEQLKTNEEKLSLLQKNFPDKLKKSLLQAAIQGKLTEQLSTDDNVDDLLAEIRKEKEKLIKEKKIKKQKPLPPITEEEIPFEIPENWRWVYWEDIANIFSSKRVHKQDWKNTGIPFYRAREIVLLSKYGKVNNELFISEKLYADLIKISKMPKKGDLMVSGVGTIGISYIVKETDKFYYKDASVLCVSKYKECINSAYLRYYLQTPYMMLQIKEGSQGTTVDTLTINKFNRYLVPLPPITEQKRIVEKLDLLLANVKNLK